MLRYVAVKMNELKLPCPWMYLKHNTERVGAALRTHQITFINSETPRNPKYCLWPGECVVKESTPTDQWDKPICEVSFESGGGALTGLRNIRFLFFASNKQAVWL